MEIILKAEIFLFVVVEAASGCAPRLELLYVDIKGLG